MATLTFDTYDFVKRLKSVGFSEEQAAAITDLQKATTTNTLDQVRHEYDLDHLATKRDLKEMELKLEKDIAEIKADLIRWIFSVVVGMGIIQIASIVFLVLKLSEH